MGNGFRIERLRNATGDCCHCPAKAVPCLVMNVFVREVGERIAEVRVSGPVALCHACASRKVASHG